MAQRAAESSIEELFLAAPVLAGGLGMKIMSFG
jgi:hypothetical protein